MGQFHWDAESYLDPMLAEVVGAPQQLHWLQAAGFSPSLIWQRRDLAVIVAEARQAG